MKNKNKRFTAIFISLAISCLTAACGSNADIGRDEAKRIALEDAGMSESDVTRITVSKESDDGRLHYDVEFANAGAEYDYEILASNGEIISSQIEKNNSVPIQSNQASTDNNSQAQADSIDNNQSRTNPSDSSQAQTNPNDNSQSQTNSGDGSQSQTNPGDGSQTQANPGDSSQTQANPSDSSQSQANPSDSSQSQPFSGSTLLTIDEAKKLALDKVPGAADQNIAIELELDDGYYIYEGEIIYNQMEYEFEIDAYTGAFLEWSTEQIYFHHDEGYGHNNHDNHH